MFLLEQSEAHTHECHDALETATLFMRNALQKGNTEKIPKGNPKFLCREGLASGSAGSPPPVALVLNQHPKIRRGTF